MKPVDRRLLFEKEGGNLPTLKCWARYTFYEKTPRKCYSRTRGARASFMILQFITQKMITHLMGECWALSVARTPYLPPLGRKASSAKIWQCSIPILSANELALNLIIFFTFRILDQNLKTFAEASKKSSPLAWEATTVQSQKRLKVKNGSQWQNHWWNHRGGNFGRGQMACGHLWINLHNR